MAKETEDKSDDDRFSNLIEEVSKKRLGLNDVEPDIIGRSYEYLIRKFAEGGGQSAGEFYTPKEVGMIMAKIMDPGPGMTIYDPCCGSAGLLIKCELALNEKMQAQGRKKFSGLTLYGQEYIAQTWAMANMNMIIHDMEGQIEIGDTFRNPKFRDNNRVSEAEEYRPIAEIVEELNALDEGAKETDALLKTILVKLGV